MTHRRVTHVIKKGQETTIPRRFITVDTETIKSTVSDVIFHNLRVGVARFWDDNDNKDEIVFWTKEEFWNWVQKIACTRGKKLTYLIAFNYQFDGTALNVWSQLPSRGWKIESRIIDGSKYIVIWSRGPYRLKLIDLGNFYGHVPLRELGKACGIQKGNEDEDPNFYETASNEKIVEYCKKDVEITERMFLRWIMFIKDNNLGTFKNTLAGQAFATFRRRFMKDEIVIHINNDAIKLERESYKGGRTECFKLGRLSKWDKKIYCLDFNSLYPSVMQCELFPRKLVKHYDKRSLSSLLNDMQKYLVIAELEVDLDRPIAGIKLDSLLFPTGIHRSVFCTPEIDYFIENNIKILNVGRVNLYEGAKIFESYVDFFYPERMKARASGNKLLDMQLKLMMNALYGKFGQRNPVTRILGECSLDEVSCVTGFCDDGTKYRHERYGGLETETTNNQIEANDTFVAIPSFVTAYGRIKLQRAIDKADPKDVEYLDTDALDVNERGYEKLRALIDPDKLGYLKVEWISDAKNIILKGCKHYIRENVEVIERDGKITLQTVRKIKGISRMAVEFEENNFTQLHFNQFKESLRSGNLNALVESQKIKKMSCEYKKGNVDADGCITPYTAEDIANGVYKIHHTAVKHPPTPKQIFTIAVRAANSSHKALLLLTRVGQEHLYDEVFTSVVGPRGGYTGKFEACPGWEMTKKKMADSIKLPKSIRKSRNKFIISFGYFRAL